MMLKRLHEAVYSRS